MKILKGEYTPITNKGYSVDLTVLISLLLERNFAKRPSIDQILQEPFVIEKAKLLNIEDFPNFEYEDLSEKIIFNAKSDEHKKKNKKDSDEDTKEENFILKSNSNVIVEPTQDNIYLNYRKKSNPERVVFKGNEENISNNVEHKNEHKHNIIHNLNKNEGKNKYEIKFPKSPRNSPGVLDVRGMVNKDKLNLLKLNKNLGKLNLGDKVPLHYNIKMDNNK